MAGWLASVSRVWGAALGLALAATQAHAGTVTVYSALEEDEIAAYVAAAKKSLADIDLKVLRLSTGDLGARILAESQHPQHDVIWGWSVSNMLDPRIIELLAPLDIPAVQTLPANARATDARWFAATGYMAAFCVNTERLKEKHLPMPKSWADLADPAFKGEVVLPSTVSSGTGYLQTVSILQIMGADKGWEFLKKLDGNVAQYFKSGSKPCKSARTGEYAVGASLAIAAMQSIQEGYPIEMVIPSEGAGYELEASALMKGSPHGPDATRFLSWSLSPEAAAIYANYKEIVTIPGSHPSETLLKAGLPPDVSKLLAPIDFKKSATERDAILAKWQSTIGR